MPDEALHCLTCGYNLTGLPENRCPECGEPFDPAELTFLRSGRGRFKTTVHLVECLYPLWAFWLSHATLLVASLILPAGAENVITLCSGLAIIVTLIMGLVSCREVAANWQFHASFRYRRVAVWFRLLGKFGVGIAFYAWLCIVVGVSVVIYALLYNVAHHVFSAANSTPF
jgi:hypothetical protein